MFPLKMSEYDHKSVYKERVDVPVQQILLKSVVCLCFIHDKLNVFFCYLSNALSSLCPSPDISSSAGKGRICQQDSEGHGPIQQTTRRDQSKFLCLSMFVLL